MNEQSSAEEILNILKNMCQEMIDGKSCHICKYHTRVPFLMGGIASGAVIVDFCKKKMSSCPFYLSCNDFEVIK